jgi:hypothetical protein
MLKAAARAGALAKGTRGDFAGKAKAGKGSGKGLSGGLKKTRQKEPTLAQAGVDKAARFRFAVPESLRGARIPVAGSGEGPERASARTCGG